MTRKIVPSARRGLLFTAGIGAGAYCAYVGTTWLRFGRVRPSFEEDRDTLLDRFMPTCDIAERHHIQVAAPAGLAFAAACSLDLDDSLIVSAIFKARELILGGKPDEMKRPTPLLEKVQALGWRVLVDEPGREIVLGAVTRPWDANVVFRPVPPEDFRAFNEPGYVKIAWTLRADPEGDRHSIVRTETRAIATDRFAQAKFRRYWCVFSPGILIIRRMMLRQIRQIAEQRANDTSL